MEQKSALRCQKPASIMVLAAVSMEAKSPLFFVEPGVKINSQYYMDRILKDTLLPWADSLYGKDGALSHTSRLTQAFLKEANPISWRKSSGLPLGQMLILY